MIHGVWRECCHRLQNQFIWGISCRTYQHWKWVLMNLEQNEINIKVNVKTYAYGSSWLGEGHSRSPLQLLAPRNKLWITLVNAALEDNGERQKCVRGLHQRPPNVNRPSPLLGVSFLSTPDSLPHQHKLSASPPFGPQTELPPISVGILSHSFQGQPDVHSFVSR